MKKLLKKTIFYLLLALNINLMAFGVALASENNSDNEFSERDYELINYSLNYLGYDSSDEVYFTEFIDVENSDRIVTIIYNNEHMIGEYVKLETEDGIYESFIIENNEYLFDLFTSDSPVIKDEIVDLPKSNNFEITEVELSYSVSSKATSTNKWSHINKAPANYLVNSATNGKIVLVDNVENCSDPVTNAGLCWTAAGASIINYYKKTSLTALSVYNSLKSAWGVSSISGNIANIQKMFNFYSMSPDRKDGKLVYNQILNTLNNGSPIFCAIHNGTYGHIVVLCGAFNISTSYGYIYMDPNVSDCYVLNYLDYSMISNSSTSYYYYSGLTDDIIYSLCNHMLYNFI
ncbi:MAG: hypothetical protein IJZ25_00360 [Lachnospiraceae bacterium]|nr:hypothetical protein [Lachnospiraceae bacterium]